MAGDGGYGRVQDNPFADSSLYAVNTTYTPPDLTDTVDAVVPAVPTATAPGSGGGAISGGGGALHGSAAHPPPPQRAPAVVPSVPAVPPQPAPVLAFTESTVAGAPVTGSMGRPAAAPPTTTAAGTSSSLPGEPDDPSSYPFWNVRRYRPLFDVDTKDVVWRVGSSFVGPLRPDFMEVTMSSPDLYGPFWVVTTLVFVTAVAGNYADLLAFRSSQAAAGAAGAAGNGTAPAPAPGGAGVAARQWYTDYAKMSFSALLLYGYVFGLGLALFFALRWFRSEIRLSNVWCIYGYSLTAFIPMAFLCIIPLGWVRWLVVGIATGVSGAFILANLKQTIFTAAPARATALLGLLAALHAGLGLALRLVFFRYRGAPEDVAAG